MVRTMYGNQFTFLPSNGQILTVVTSGVTEPEMVKGGYTKI